MNSTYINPNSSANVNILTSYASGIETMRQAMITGGDTSILESYASGTNVLARNIEAYSSGIETLRRAMVITGGDVTEVTIYASGINTQLIAFQGGQTSYNGTIGNNLSGVQTTVVAIQGNIGNLSTYTSGVQEQLNDFQISQTSVNIGIESYASGIETLRRAMTGSSYDDSEIKAYSSGIETLRRAMVTTGGDTTAVTTYASGIDTQLILIQAEQTIYNTQMTAYSSGIETLRRAMVITGGDTTEVTAYASGTRTLQITIQNNVTGLAVYTSGVQEQLSDFQIAQTNVNTRIETYASGIETLRRAMIDDDSIITSYASGTRTLEITIQNNATELTSYASGTKTLQNTIQNNQTFVTSYASGIETLNILNQSNINLVTSYASGTKTLLNIVQNNLTCNDNTTSGINTTVIGLSRYASGTHNANTIIIPNGVGSPTYDDMQDFLQMTRSSGRITSGVLTLHSGNPVGAVDISVMEGMIFTEDRLGADYIFFKQAAKTDGLVVADNVVSWVYYDWNAGSPRYSSTTTRAAIHEYDQFAVGRVFRAGNGVELQLTGHNLYDKDRRSHNRLILKYGGMDRVSGGVVSQHTTPLRIQSNIGSWYVANKPFTTPANDTFQVWYKTGGGAWAESGDLTLFSDVFDSGTSKVYETYQNGTSLAALGANKYGVYWIFMCPEGDLYVVLGTGSYANIGAAQASTVPASLPPYCVDWARLVGRVICKNSNATLYSVESSFATSFTLSAATDHSSLANLTAANSHPITAITDLDAYLSGTKVLNVLNQSNINVIANVSLINTTVTHTGAGTASIGAWNVVTAAAEYTITLPTAVGNTGKVLGIRCSSNNYPVLIAPFTGEAVWSPSQGTTTTGWYMCGYNACIFTSDGTRWVISNETRAVSNYTYLDLDNTMSATTINTAIAALPKQIVSNLYLRFADGNYALNAATTVSNFYGGGILYIQGNTGESSTTLHVNQGVNLNYSGTDCHGVYCYGDRVYVYMTNIKVNVDTSISARTGIYIITCADAYIAGCYVVGTSITQGNGIFVNNSVSRVNTCYVANVKYGVAAQNCVCYSNGNDDYAADTSPAYGLYAASAQMAKNGTQPSGSTAEESIVAGAFSVSTTECSIKLDDLTAPTDNTDLNATTSLHGLTPKAVAPGANILTVLGIANGETAWANKVLFDSTNPAALGTAAPGTSLSAAHRDHVHPSLKTIEAHTTDDILTIAESNSTHTNEGAGGAVALTLPTASAGMQFIFRVHAAQYLRINAALEDTIRGATVTVLSGYVRSNTAGNWIALESINNTEWVNTGIGGTWTVDS
jgi:hypothetical protein